MKHVQLQTKPFIKEVEYRDKHGIIFAVKKVEYWCQGNLKYLRRSHNFKTYECQECGQALGQMI